MKTIKLIILALAAFVVSSNVWGETDVLTASDFQATNTTYKAFSGVSKTSSAIYAGNTAKNNDAQIQLRSSDNAGIVSTTSGGKVIKVSVSWGTSTVSGRTLDIYGKATAYTGSSDLYSSDTQGTKLGTIVYGTSTELVISGDYSYIGLRSNSGAMYLASISIEWVACSTPLLEPNVTATPGDNQATLTWQDVANATGYKVSWNGGADENPTDTRTFTKTGLTNGTQYTWKVKAIGDATYCDSETSGSVTPVAPPATATVTWVVDGTTYKTSTNVTIGSTISTPTNPSAPASCGDAIFKGWTANQDYFHETAAPDDLFNGTSPAITADITFYAVFADRQ